MSGKTPGFLCCPAHSPEAFRSAENNIENKNQHAQVSGKHRNNIRTMKKYSLLYQKVKRYANVIPFFIATKQLKFDKAFIKNVLIQVFPGIKMAGSANNVFDSLWRSCDQNQYVFYC
ncbi:Uncharacterized protein dnm_079250 [Desulfonema magnum]|uniref:Uncharacterized protein n=1 Tax=Desulfonema magnum TaxID=45655 RepID=A0A975BU80_9BACT|nr:Uncharacterized protein dnm_079250 [Desulfonema magnum]